MLPAAILARFCRSLALGAARSPLAAAAVTIVPVVVERGVVAAAGTPLFQAAGWIEPRPTPIQRYRARPKGFIELLLVVEDQAVTKGRPVAESITSSMPNCHDHVAIAEAELQHHEADVLEWLEASVN